MKAARQRDQFAKERGREPTVSELAQALQVSEEAVVEALDGLPAHKVHCSVLAEEAIKKALQDYYERNGIAYDPQQFPDCESCTHCTAEK